MSFLMASIKISLGDQELLHSYLYNVYGQRGIHNKYIIKERKKGRRTAIMLSKTFNNK